MTVEEKRLNKQFNYTYAANEALKKELAYKNADLNVTFKAGKP